MLMFLFFCFPAASKRRVYDQYGKEGLSGGGGGKHCEMFLYSFSRIHSTDMSEGLKLHKRLHIFCLLLDLNPEHSGHSDRI